jgi:predicted phage replisome organizer
MAENGKYYWLKLKRDFFKRHDIRIIEEMPNGKDYILFYLKLLLESIDHNGSLRFSDTIPYNEQMLSVVTNTNIDIVRSAMKLFVELNMMSICDDKTIYMNEVEKLIGGETRWAEKKRLQRAKEDNVPTLSPNCPTELDIDKELELKKEKDKDLDFLTTTTTGEPPTMTQIYAYFKSLDVENSPKEAEKFYTYNAKMGWTCLPDWKTTADLWIARIGG